VHPSFPYRFGFVPSSERAILTGFVLGRTMVDECTASFLDSPNFLAFSIAHNMFARIFAERRVDVSVAAASICNCPLSLGALCQMERPVWNSVGVATCEKSISKAP
jgi:hypothetical protein